MTAYLHPPRNVKDRPRVVVLMGVSGAGKTTTGKRLARALGWTFRDGDSFHPEANVAKMSAGIPLTDDDRWPWLDAISAWIAECRQHDEYGVVACSALRRVYRDRLAGSHRDVLTVYLRGSKELIADRMSRRTNHFMPPALLDSQFAALEEPTRDERALIVSVALPPGRVVHTIRDFVLTPQILPHQRPKPIA